MRRVTLGACLGCLAVSIGTYVAPPTVTLAQPTHHATRCGTYRFGGQQYGVYAPTGKVTCGTATAVLRAVAGGAGRFVDRGGSANSYTLYGGWLCPVGQMGEQTCEHDTHPVSHPKQQIASLACRPAQGEQGCPRRAVFLTV